MSRRTILSLALGAFLLPFLIAGALILVFPERSPFRGPVYTESIPATRPSDPDRRLRKRFQNQSINEIVLALRTERKRKDESSLPPEEIGRREQPAILSMLPDAPLPFLPDAKPLDEEGLKTFVQRMKTGQESSAMTQSEQWQFNLALAALGVKPEEIPATIRLETRPAPESSSYPIRLRRIDTSLRGPLALGDFDGEEGVEIAANGGSTFYKVESDGKLVESTALSEVEPGQGLYPADFDGDGRLDLLVTRRGGMPDSLLRNLGDGRFEDETAARGLLAFGDTVAAAWIDFDHDGRLDLVLGYSDRPIELYRQNEKGGFEPSAWELGLWVPHRVTTLATADIDEDGYLDLFVGRDGAPSRLFLSRPDETGVRRHFVLAEGEFAFGDAGSVSAAAFTDCDNDGRQDLVVATASPAAGTSSVRLFHNEGEARLVDITESSGFLCANGVLSVGVIDLDLDGYEDLVLGTVALASDSVFANQQGAGYSEVTVASQGGYLSETTSWRFGDLRGDGGTQIFAVQGDGRVRNLETEGATGHWLRVLLPGQRLGTKVVASVRDSDWIAHSFHCTLGTDNSLRIGLGSGKIVEKLEIFTPGLSQPLETLEKVAADHVIVVKAPSAGNAPDSNASDATSESPAPTAQ